MMIAIIGVLYLLGCVLMSTILSAYEAYVGSIDWEGKLIFIIIWPVMAVILLLLPKTNQAGL